MIVELLLASCLGQQAPPTQPPPPADQAPPVSTPAPVQPPIADVPGVPASPPVDAAPRTRPTAPRAARTAQGAPMAPAVLPPPGQNAPGDDFRRGPRGFGGDVYGRGMQSGAPAMAMEAIYGYSRRAVDPKDAELDRKARETAGALQREQDPAKKAQIKASLQAMVAEQFQVRQQRRAEEMKRLEDEVKKLRDALEKRERAKDAIIARRVAELTGEDDLGF
jgi:hypothetical protein